MINPRWAYRKSLNDDLSSEGILRFIWGLKLAISKQPWASVSKGILEQTLLYENEFEFEPVGGTHFHVNGFALRLETKDNSKMT